MIDQELVAEFVQESSEHLADVETQLLHIEALGENIDDDLVNTVFRAVHSIKGAAGFLDLTRINQLAHCMEGVLNKIREHELIPDPYNVDVLLRAADRLRSLVEDVAGSNATDNTDLCNALFELLEQKPAAASEGGDSSEPVDGTEPADTPEQRVGTDLATAEAGVDALQRETAAEPPEPTPELTPGPTPTPEPTPPAATPPPAVNTGADPEPKPPAVEASPKAEPDDTPARPAAVAPDPTIRVSVNVLDRLMNLAGELVLSRNQLLRGLEEDDHDASLDTIAGRLDQVTTQMQEAIMQTRMQPISTVFNKFPRIIRTLSQSLGKKIELSIEGGEVETDKTIIEAIADPLTHLIRNSCDHGIETPERREAAGKSVTGGVRLRASHQAGKVVIEIMDDGAGMDPQKLKDRAVERGLLTHAAAAAMGDQEALHLIFRPGFSTAAEVTDVSGRGVGMDVVRTNIEQLGGTVELDSVVGSGSTVRITLPLTLAIMPSMIVTVGGAPYALPQVNVIELVQPNGQDKRVERVHDVEVLRLRGQLLPLVRLRDVLGDATTGGARSDGPAATGPLMVVENGRHQFALAVDEVLDSEEIVVKPLGRHLVDLPLISGSTILGNGRIAMILDLGGITDAAGIDNGDAETAAADSEAVAEEATDMQRLVLFSHGPDRFALSMDIVRRIERIASDRIDSVGNQRLLQYRGGTLPLVGVEEGLRCVGDGGLPPHVHIIVYSVCGHEVGMIAPDLHDISDCDLVLSNRHGVEPGVAGLVVIDGITTRVLDLYGLTQRVRPDWFDVAMPGADDPTPSKPMDILFAEDSRFFRNFLRDALTEIGHRVTECPDGQHAWEIIRKDGGRYDLILTDIEMPKMDGFELTRRIRGQASTADTPIIALSTLSDRASIQRGMDAGVTNYQVKMNKPSLLAAIARFGGGKHSETHPQAATA